MRKALRYCPFCNNPKPLVRAGFDLNGKQRWLCTDKPCRRITINPLKKRTQVKEY